MKKKFLLLILISLCIVQGVSGFSVSIVSINPSGYLGDGTPVTITFDIPDKDILLYDQLVMTTDLDGPVWDPHILVKDQDKPLIPAYANGNRLTINGAAFRYPSGVQSKVRIQLKGTVPSNRTAGQKLLNIRQVDADGTEYAYPSGYNLPMPVSPATTLSIKDMITATPAQNPSGENTITVTQTSAPAVSSPITTVPASKKSTRSVPTPWPGNTETTVSPVDPLVIIGVIGMIIYMLRR